MAPKRARQPQREVAKKAFRKFHSFVLRQYSPMTLVPAYLLQGSQVGSRIAMHTLDELEPESKPHNVARYSKHRSSSSSEVARGPLRRTHDMREGMKTRNSVLTGRQEAGNYTEKSANNIITSKTSVKETSNTVPASVHHTSKNHPAIF